MTTTAIPRAAAALVEHADPIAALDEALARVRRDLGDAPATLAMLFASSEYEPEYERLVATAYERLGGALLIGCSGEGVIGPRQESERRPALSLLVQSLPDADFHAARISFEQFESVGADTLVDMTGVAPGSARGWLFLADPYSMNAEALIERFHAVYPSATLLGGMASSTAQRTHIFLNDRVYEQGAVALAITRPYALRAVVSQGASPLGRPWTITEADANIVQSIGGRPAYDVLVETVQALEPAVAERAVRGLLIGLAMDEYREEFGRGDFLIRNLVGYDPDSKAIAINAQARVGQTLQFQFRDAEGADEELRTLLAGAQAEAGESRPVAAVLCSCNGRGTRMFGVPDHDAAALDDAFAGLPVGGLFCAGEIGPVGPQTFVHGFTASIGFITREE